LRKVRPSMSLSDGVANALHDILQLVVPQRIEFSAISKHLKGYNREEAIKTIIERAQANPILTRVQLFIIYNKLDEVVKRGDLP